MQSRRLLVAEARKPPRPFGVAGKSVLSPCNLAGGPALPPRPDSVALKDDDDGLGEEVMWSRQLRAEIKGESAVAAAGTKGVSSSPTSARPDAHSIVRRSRSSSPAHSVVSLALPSSLGNWNRSSPSPVSIQPPSPDLQSSLSSSKVTNDLLAKARSDAKARMSAYFEDLIAFLEMHSLTGAYALAFSAHGIEDLTQLLTLEDSALEHLIQKCDIDAMDEILLRDALRGTRISR